MNTKNRFMPFLLALCTVIGILIGSFYTNHFAGNRLNIINTESNRLNNLLRIIDDQYVDSVNVNNLVENAIPQILSELDPHSVYISAKDVATTTDDLKGSFFGIGIQFTIREDTIHVEDVIADGPAERAGIVAGDKIVEVDGKPFVGEKVNNQEAMRLLKGEKGSKVTVGIMGYGSKKIKRVALTRDEIRTNSVTAAYMLDDNTGYIKVKNFGENTYSELLVALATLSQENLQNLVIDLRDNTGGYMQTAVQMANEFLPAKCLITYMEGRRSPRKNFYSDGRGSYKNIPLVVLINEGSASASEIFAGAIQDNDRGTIIGRRSFGKGLVQQQISFPDGSMIRLTIARYYSPSGRCIQKPYKLGDGESYEQDLIDRYKNGEYFSQDSIKHDGPEYLTTLGRKVYGGGGITPDYFIAEDTSAMTSYYKKAVMTGLMMKFAYQYTDENRQKLSAYGDMKSLSQYLVGQNIVERFASFAEKNGLKRRNLMIRRSHILLERFIMARVIYNILDEEALTEYLNQSDPAIENAIEIFSEGKAFPEKPASEKKVNGKKEVGRSKNGK